MVFEWRGELGKEKKNAVRRKGKRGDKKEGRDRRHQPAALL